MKRGFLDDYWNFLDSGYVRLFIPENGFLLETGRQAMLISRQVRSWMWHMILGIFNHIYEISLVIKFSLMESIMTLVNEWTFFKLHSYWKWLFSHVLPRYRAQSASPWFHLKTHTLCIIHSHTPTTGLFG